ncbi:MAG TPA: FliH/SctL family protein [Candidatus Brocadiia bacterium]|nr:hypothetical protein [Planctomycetota bacterium]MDO8092226.1 FliH/SctL family protein [Candidatus Brocadiales bacterium]
MRRVYSSPIIDGIYVLNYTNAPVRRKGDGPNAASIGDNKSIEDARKEIEASKQEMYRKGISDGCKQVEDKLSTVFRAFQDAARQLQCERHNIWQKSETEIIKLVLAIAQKVVGCEIANNNYLIEKVVAEAILQAERQKIVSIRLNPADVTGLKEAKIMANSDSTFEIVADQKISPGGCIVETDFGCIDARLETRMNEIINQMLSHSEGGTDKLVRQGESASGMICP